jgi:hypothetical protein
VARQDDQNTTTTVRVEREVSVAEANGYDDESIENRDKLRGMNGWCGYGRLRLAVNVNHYSGAEWERRGELRKRWEVKILLLGQPLLALGPRCGIVPVMPNISAGFLAPQCPAQVESIMGDSAGICGRRSIRHLSRHSAPLRLKWFSVA